MNTYPAYKDSGIEWLGEIPGHWEVKKLKYATHLKSGFSITSELIEQEGMFPVFGGNGIRGFYDDYTHDGEFALIGRQGALCGNINYAKGKFWASEHAVVATPISNHDVVWLGELLRAMNLNQYSISAAQPGLAVDRVRNLLVPFPPLPEQHAIAAYLDRQTQALDELIADKRRLIALYQEERAALINQAVTRGLDPEVPMKDSGIEWLGEIPGHWEVKRLKYVALVNPESLSENTDSERLIRYLDIGDISLGQILGEPTEYTFENAPSRARRIVQEKDVIVSTVRTYLKAIAQITIDPSDLIVSTGFAVVRGKDGTDKSYLAWFFSCEKTVDTICAYSVGVSYPAVNSSDVANLPIWLPPLPEQRAIATYLDHQTQALDTQIADTEREIELLQEYRTALISEVVTGKVDVRGEMGTLE